MLKKPQLIIPLILTPFHLIVENDIKSNYTDAVVGSLSETVRAEVREALRIWLPACGESIEFNYLDKLEPDQLGITIIACDKHKKCEWSYGL